MYEFIHTGLPYRIVFGPGQLSSMADELTQLGVKRPLLIVSETDSGLLTAARNFLGDVPYTEWTSVAQHVPIPVAEAAVAEAVSQAADGIVTIGGGSTTGMGKAIARRLGLPILAVPTTYAGSEMTPIWGETSDGRKVTGRDARAQPRTVIYDVNLTLTLPAALSAASGMNAFAHCAEATFAPGQSPMNTSFAVEAMKNLTRGLPIVMSEPDNLDARGEVLLGACLSGVVLASAGISIHHHICHVLGGMYNLPHAELHSVVLAYALQHIERASPGTLSYVGEALNVDAADAPAAVRNLTRELGLPQSLSEIGMKESDITDAVTPLVESTANDLTPLSPAAARDLLNHAVHGQDDWFER